MQGWYSRTNYAKVLHLLLAVSSCTKTVEMLRIVPELLQNTEHDHKRFMFRPVHPQDIESHCSDQVSCYSSLHSAESTCENAIPVSAPANSYSCFVEDLRLAFLHTFPVRHQHMHINRRRIIPANGAGTPNELF